MTTTSAEGPSRGLCLVLVALGGAVLVLLGAVAVPWAWVPGGHVVPVAADQVFGAREIARGEAFSSSARHLGWASLAVSLVLSLLLGLTPWGSRLAARLRGPWWWRVVLGAGAVLLLGRLATLWFAWRSRALRLDASLTDQPFSGWARDVGVAFALSWFTVALGLVVLVALARRSPRRWPLWAALAAAGLVATGSFLWPVTVEPLFNSFTSLSAGSLRTEVLDLAAREGVPVRDVLVADASRRTTSLNAYVSGFGGTRRVVLYDTLLREPRREVLVVVAHELGHARDGDVALGTAMGAAGAFLGVGLLGLVLGSTGVRRRAGVVSAAEPAVVALVLALVAVGTLAASPVENVVSRAVEARADRTSLAATGDEAGFVALQRRLAARSLSDPTPPRWSQLWFGSHPTALQRVGIAEGLAARPRLRRRHPGRPRKHLGRAPRERGAAEVVAAGVGQEQVAVELTALQVPEKTSLSIPPKRKTTATMRAASRPYSTAQAPSSERILAQRPAVQMRRQSTIGSPVARHGWL